jgi:hypothetical protein
LRQPDVADDDVEQLPFDVFHTSRAIARALHSVPGLGELLFENVSEVSLIIYKQNVQQGNLLGPGCYRAVTISENRNVLWFVSI